MSQIFKIELNYIAINCAEEQCGVTFAIDNGFDERLRNSHRNFFCPNGHTNHYPHKNQEEILRERLSAKDEIIAKLEKDLAKKKRKNRAKK